MPREPQMRASDVDRERAASMLREHHAEGRLTPEEFNERLDRCFEAKTIGDLEALLADLPGIDLYRLPAAGIRPAPPGARRPRSVPDHRTGGSVAPFRAGAWMAWTAISALLLVVWLGVGVVSGGAAWLPWFLLISVPWAVVLARRPR